MRIAVVHDWLVTYAGCERALEQILLLYPEADLYSLVDFLPEGQQNFILNKKVKTSFLQTLPFAKSQYRNYLPLMPLAVKGFDLSQYDLVLSCSHAVAKGVFTRPGQRHICYCCTPIRYAWDLRDLYLREAGLDLGLKGKVANLILDYIKNWDFLTSKEVDHFIAISKYISRRIERAYKRDSVVIYPPVDVESFNLETDKEDFYLTASRMVPYKRMTLIVEAFSTMPKKKLVVIGDGPDAGKVKSKATANVEFLGYQPTDVLKRYMQKAKAFIFAAEEDFGIMLVEVQACGTPVIAFGKGGATETVLNNTTGIFFMEQKVESLIEAIRRFENIADRFNPYEIRKNAERFKVERFRQEFKGFVEKCLSS